MEQAGHFDGHCVGDFGAFAPVLADEFAEMGGLVVKAASDERLVEFDFASVEVMDRCAGGVPPVGMEKDVSAGGA